jgi:hypothetical protein
MLTLLSSYWNQRRLHLCNLPPLGTRSCCPYTSPLSQIPRLCNYSMRIIHYVDWTLDLVWHSEDTIEYGNTLGSTIGSNAKSSATEIPMLRILERGHSTLRSGQHLYGCSSSSQFARLRHAFLKVCEWLSGYCFHIAVRHSSS